MSSRKTVKAAYLGSYQVFMVRGCVPKGAKATKFGAIHFETTGPKGQNYTIEIVTGARELSPSLPDERTVRPGKCLQGGVNFRTKAKLVELVYTDLRDPDQEASWKLR